MRLQWDCKTVAVKKPHSSCVTRKEKLRIINHIRAIVKTSCSHLHSNLCCISSILFIQSLYISRRISLPLPIFDYRCNLSFTLGRFHLYPNLLVQGPITTHFYNLKQHPLTLFFLEKFLSTYI